MTDLEKFTRKIARLSTEMLKDLIKKAFNDVSDEAAMILIHSMKELEKRIDSESFVKFCKSF